MPKTAKSTPCCFDVECPHCKGTIESPDSSLFWTRNELDLAQGKVVTCFECKKPVKLPIPRR